MPEMQKKSKSLEVAAKDMQARIRSQVPTELKDTVVVRVFKKGKSTGLTIEYDDRAENFVYASIEYPKRK